MLQCLFSSHVYPYAMPAPAIQAVKSNLLYDAMLTLDLGVEVGVAPQWSVELTGNLLRAVLNFSEECCKNNICDKKSQITSKITPPPGIHPYTGKEVFAATTPAQKEAQRQFFFWYDPAYRSRITAELELKT